MSFPARTARRTSESVSTAEGFRDEGDVRFLLRALNIESYTQAVNINTRYFDEGQLPQKTWYALDEMLDDSR